MVSRQGRQPTSCFPGGVRTEAWAEQRLPLAFTMHPGDQVREELPLVPPADVESRRTWTVAIGPASRDGKPIPVDVPCVLHVVANRGHADKHLDPRPASARGLTRHASPAGPPIDTALAASSAPGYTLPAFTRAPTCPHPIGSSSAPAAGALKTFDCRQCLYEAGARPAIPAHRQRGLGPATGHVALDRLGRGLRRHLHRRLGVLRA